MLNEPEKTLTVTGELTGDKPQAWREPWEKLRDLTSQYNQVKGVADRYSKMYRLALTQYRELTELSAKQDTLDGLSWMLNFLKEKSEKLWPVVDDLAKRIETETEKLNNA